MSLQDIDPQFRLDSEVAPTYVVKDYDIDTGEFHVYIMMAHLPTMIGMVLSIWI